MKNNIEVVLAAVKKSGMNLCYASEKMKNTIVRHQIGSKTSIKVLIITRYHIIQNYILVLVFLEILKTRSLILLIVY